MFCSCFSFAAKNLLELGWKIRVRLSQLNYKIRNLKIRVLGRHADSVREPLAKGLGSQNTGGLSKTHCILFLNVFLL